MSPEVAHADINQVLEVRHTDEALLNIRLHLLQRQVLPSLMEDASYESFNNWQQDTIERLQAGMAAAQVVDLPTRSGKSYLMRQMAAASLNEGLVPVVVAHRTHILNEHAVELEQEGVTTAGMSLSSQEPTDLLNHVNLLSTHSIAVNAERDAAVATDQVDVVYIDEVHRAMGEKTLLGMRRLFPNAVLITFTATPDYATNRSASDHYGDKIISHSIVEAIEEGKAPPVRMFLYKTDDEIDYLDPSKAEFTPRELRRLARSKARNAMIVDMAQDLVQNGRQGLVTTIPGDNLLHAEILATSMSDRLVTLPNGESRPMKVRVMRGTDHDTDEALEAYENGEYDILLYCNLLREGYTTKVASFLLNGWPRTSVVDLTQDIGRVLEPKEGEMIIADFLDDSIKRQCTAYDVLELDRVTQAIVAESPARNTPQNPTARASYMRDLFRPEIVDKLQQHDNVLIEDLRYNTEPIDAYERHLLAFRREEAREFRKQQRIWEKLLKKEGLAPEQPDHFGVHYRNDKLRELVDPEKPSLGYRLPTAGHGASSSEHWVGITGRDIIVPPVATPHEDIEDVPDFAPLHEMEELAINNDMQWAIGYAMSSLEERERNIMRMRHGLDGKEPLTLEQTAAKIGLTRERIRQIEARAMSKLRHPEQYDLLGPFVREQDFKRVHRRPHALTSDDRVALQKRKLTQWILKNPTLNEATTPEQKQAIEEFKMESGKTMKERDDYFAAIPELAAATLGIHRLATDYEKNRVHQFFISVIRNTAIGRYDYPGITQFISRIDELDLTDEFDILYEFYQNATHYDSNYAHNNEVYQKKIKLFIEAFLRKVAETSVE